MTDHVTYKEHLEFLRRDRSSATAELHGFYHAASLGSHDARYSSSTRLQAIYERGFADGKAMLEQDRLRKGTT